MIELRFKKPSWTAPAIESIDEAKFSFQVLEDFLSFSQLTECWTPTSLYNRQKGVFKAAPLLYHKILVSLCPELDGSNDYILNPNNDLIFVADCSHRGFPLYAVILVSRQSQRDALIFFGGAGTPAVIPLHSHSSMSLWNLEASFKDPEKGVGHKFPFSDPFWHVVALYPEKLRHFWAFEELFKVSDLNPLTGLMRDKGAVRTCAAQLEQTLQEHRLAWMSDLSEGLGL